MLPDAGGIKKAMANLCNNAADLGITHAEQELGMQPRSFARIKKSVSAEVDRIITDYSNTRAFYITGLAKQDILDAARSMILNWTKTHLEPIPSEEFVAELTGLLEEWLPGVENISARAAVIARTNISDLYNFSRYTLFTGDVLKGWVEAFQYSAILDGRTTVLCRGLHGRIFTREDLAASGLIPPNHYNCRSILLPITRLDKDWQEVYQAQGQITESPQEGF